MANETITGKIFTLKDPTGTYNRFPRTVMEAVYGLNTYLQNQFSALADIYMPIEGITESKPLQEFVYRLCPSSIKAKSVSLDRIYGKTLAWNQLVRNGNFSDTSAWSALKVTFSVSNNVASVYAASNGDNYVNQSMPMVIGHKYLFVGDCKSGTANSSAFYLFHGTPGTSGGQSTITVSTTDVWVHCHLFFTCTGNDVNAVRMQNSYGGTTNYFRNMTLIDLTLMFGADKEPATVEEFESMFPGYHSYSAGKLISNDAESIETVGFNQMNEDLDKFDSTHLVTKYIEVLPNTDYYLKYPTNSGAGIVWYYDANKNTIKTDNPALNNHVFTTPAGTRYIRLLFPEAYGTTYNHDICINLSDPAKNGTYEPYRKSTMQLGLGSFQVRDSQGNVMTIEGGLKSAGSVRDEIVGNKYINRVGSVDLGTLNWSFISADNMMATVGLNNVAKRETLAPVICALFSSTTNAGSSNMPLNSCAFQMNYQSSGTLSLKVKTTDYTDAATFKSAMSGVKLNYELATPIEYELVSPLVPTVKAGETEARISPNADGLSAPMVADMTYDAQANNDSASAQYALTAGRLLNSHKLWGQDFDGTQDVAGALTGVTDLNSLLYLGSTNVGIGQSNPQYKLDVSGTARFTGAATLGSTLSVAGNTTVGGTLGVTGSTTLTGALTANGAVSINNTLTVGTSQTNRATTLNGTLTVTGLTSIAGGLKLTTTKKIWFDDTHYLELLTDGGTQYLHTNLNVVSDAGVVAGASANS